MTASSSVSPEGRASIRVRPYAPDDAPFVLQLAQRLVIGIPPWRDPQRMLATAQGWLTGSMAHHGGETMVFIAEDERGNRLGAAAVLHHQHFTGEREAYIGELAASEAEEGHGVGQALVEACARWARDQGYSLLVLQTGTANTRARGFYQRLGFWEEDIRLTKRL